MKSLIRLTHHKVDQQTAHQCPSSYLSLFNRAYNISPFRYMRDAGKSLHNHTAGRSQYKSNNSLMSLSWPLTGYKYDSTSKIKLTDRLVKIKRNLSCGFG